MRFQPVQRKVAGFLEGPPTVRGAMKVIIFATLMTVIGGGVAIWLVDGDDFPNPGIGMWWALQTVTTVGYGDVVPTNALGRLVGAAIMLQAIAFLTVVTASITSTFVDRARREARRQEQTAAEPDSDHHDARLAEIEAQLDRIEAALERLGPSGAQPGEP